MIDCPAFVQAAKKLLVTLEDDLRKRAALEDFSASFKAEYAQAQEKGRTAQDYDSWLDERLTQIGAAWILACVFLRFLEDNDFLAAPLLSGPGDRLKRAGEHREAYFRSHPSHSDREYLEELFRDLSRLPGMKELLDQSTNPLWQLGPTAEGAGKLVSFFRDIDPESGEVQWQFGHEEADTRFLGDLYQDLSEAARKRYALLQTPDFIEAFILDRTLEPAIAEFGLEHTTLIDPTCGSGHFLLGAFERLLNHWEQRGEATTPARVQRVLDAIAGVDVNPFAVAIARFRLLLAALRAADCHRLSDAPDFHFHLAAGDSLLHGRRPMEQGLTQALLVADDLDSVYEVEDKEALREILGRSYSAVVGNPPYITVKDKALNAAYRERFPRSCHRQYSLAVPFKERFFDLASFDDGPAGFWGMITANSFLKREFGKKLIEKLIPTWDLTHVIDTSGAYIPGHGTPTVILFGRARKPVAPTVRAVMGIRGEPSTPEDPAKGLVWTEIIGSIDQAGSEGLYVSTDDVERSLFGAHPWSIAGGGAAKLKERIESSGTTVLRNVVKAIGRTTVVGEDDAWIMDSSTADRLQIGQYVVPFVIGEVVRDWGLGGLPVVIYPYESLGGIALSADAEAMLRTLWPNRTVLSARSVFGKKITHGGRAWWEHLEHYVDKLRTPLSITFAEVATHNHFVLDRGGKVFKQTAPVIKLPATATEDDHLALLGLLNSSTACFWMKQVCYPKSSVSGDISAVKGRPEANRYQYSGTQMAAFPIPDLASLTRLTILTRKIDALSYQLAKVEPAAIIAGQAQVGEAEFVNAGERFAQLLRRMVYLQEEIDWEAYDLYHLDGSGLGCAAPDAVFEISPDWRPAFWGGEGPPVGLPRELKKLYEARRRAIAESKSLRLLETPVFKRLWLGRQGVFGHSTATYADKVTAALRIRLLDHIEEVPLWKEHRLITAGALTERLRDDQKFMQIAALFRKRDDFDLVKLVAELTEAEGVPYLSALRYKDPGLRKRATWEKTWELQREEDAAEARGESFDVKIPVPPKYKSADFLKASYWSHRGKLDVPKERFILYPGAERPGETGPLLGWAGWNEKERCIALFSWITERKESDGWGKEELAPLLFGVLELLPWLKQWHNEPELGEPEGFASQIERIFDEDVRSLGLTRDDLVAWRPLKKTRGRKKKA